jgi:hypothetical protein
VLPEMVVMGENGLLTINYDIITTVSLKAVKEQIEILDKLEKELENYELIAKEKGLFS